MDTKLLPTISANIQKQISTEAGWWATCPGCSKTTTGHFNEKLYPHSEIFGCQLGTGCKDCGGIGATWIVMEPDMPDVAHGLDWTSCAIAVPQPGIDVYVAVPTGNSLFGPALYEARFLRIHSSTGALPLFPEKLGEASKWWADAQNSPESVVHLTPAVCWQYAPKLPTFSPVPE